MRSETCRANICDEETQSLINFVYLVGLRIYYKMIHGPYNIKLSNTKTHGGFYLQFNIANSMLFFIHDSIYILVVSVFTISLLLLAFIFI